MTFVYNDGHDATWEVPADVEDEWGATTTIPKLALEYISEYPLDNTAIAFVDNMQYDNPNIGYFSYDVAFKGTSNDIARVTLNSPINGVKWHIPSRNELASIFPQGFDLSGYGDRKFVSGVTSYNTLESNVQIGSLTQDFLSDYKMTDNELYAIRFKSKSNRHRTAFRYSTVGSLVGKDRRLKIECVYLGNENIALSDVAQSSFWTTRSTSIVTREFPYTGWTQTSGEVVNQGLNSGIVSSTQYDETTYYTRIRNGNY